MSSELIIGAPFLERIDSGMTRLSVEVHTEDRAPTLWYETQEQYGEYFCEERSDAFVVNLLLYAMEKECDIVCEAPMSERLYYQLTEYLIPAIAGNISKYKPIRISARTDSTILSVGNAVGGSLSGGVDSFYTLFRHLGREETSSNITHLTFFNAGASGSYGGESARQRYVARATWVAEVADSLSLPLVCVDTNINEFLLQDHEATHTFRTLAIPLAMQKLFSRYYFSSGVPFCDFGFFEHDTAYYDLLNVHMLSTESISFYSSGAEVSRLEKIAFISDYEISHNKLNVCVAEDINCSKCEKCQRTMVEIDLLGKKDAYEKVFDWDYYDANRRRYYSSSVLRKEMSDWAEIYRLLVERGLMTLDVRFYGLLRKAKRNVLRLIRNH